MEIICTTILLLAISLALTIIAAIVAGLLTLAKYPFKKSFKRGLWILIIPPLALLYGAFIERNTLQTREVEIASNNTPQSFDGYRIIHISDIHLRSFQGREKTLEKFVDKINAQEADAILFTGDLVTQKTSELTAMEGILKKMRAKDGVFSILGNHDYSFYNRWKTEEERIKDAEALIDRQKAMQWDILLNECRNIARGKDSISIIGVGNTSTNRKFRSFGNLQQALQDATGKFKILMSHDPSHWRSEVIDKTDIDLTLSGHTHSMQFTIFGWSIISYVYKEFNGLYREKNQYLYVNIGLGETMFPFRIGAAPEMTVITLKKR